MDLTWISIVSKEILLRFIEALFSHILVLTKKNDQNAINAEKRTSICKISSIDALNGQPAVKHMTFVECVHCYKPEICKTKWNLDSTNVKWLNLNQIWISPGAAIPTNNPYKNIANQVQLLRDLTIISKDMNAKTAKLTTAWNVFLSIKMQKFLLKTFNLWKRKQKRK